MKPYALAVDIGGTNIRSALVTRDGAIHARVVVREHAERGPDVVIDSILFACGRTLAESGVDRCEVEAVALGFGGTVNGREGLVLVSSNLPAWDHYPLRDHVAQRLGLPVLLDNDTNLAALGEHRFGAGQGVANMAYVTISTGLGLGVIVEDRLVAGCSGTAGEIGHAVVQPGGPLCTCGKRGCLMAYASGIGLSRMAYERLATGEPTLLRARCPAGGRRVTGEVLLAAAEEGDAVAQEILRTFALYCGVGLSWVHEILNPQLIVVGGGLMNLGDWLWTPMMEAMYEHTQPEIHSWLQVKPWRLGDDTGLLGAAAKVFAEAEQAGVRA
jgi:glucokinase